MEKYLLQIEALLLVADSPLTASQIQALFSEEVRPELEVIESLLVELKNKYALDGKSVLELQEVSSGFRFQIKREHDELVRVFKQTQKTKCSRALLETLVIIAAHQPITRNEIEEIRGVRLNPAIMKQLLEYEWIKKQGELDVPGKPGLYATTQQFLDDFQLTNIEAIRE